MSGQSENDGGSHDDTVNDSGNSSGAVDSAAIPAVDDVAGKRRGGWPKGKPRARRDSGSGNAGSAASGTAARKPAARAQETALSLAGIEGALTGIHIALATLTGNEIWALQPAEASNIAKAAENVAKHYPNLAGHEKLVDWIMLIQALGMVYGPRLYLSIPKKEKRKPPAEATAPKSAAPGVIFPFGGQ